MRVREVTSTGARVVLFDGACGLCTWCVLLARRIDRRGLYAFVPSQDCAAEDLARLGLTSERLSRAVYVIEGGARAYRGALGINRFLWSFRTWRPLIVLLYWAWPLLVLEIAAYEFVARNRVWISRVLGTAKFALIADRRGSAERENRFEDRRRQ